MAVRKECLRRCHEPETPLPNSCAAELGGGAIIRDASLAPVNHRPTPPPPRLKQSPRHADALLFTQLLLFLSAVLKMYGSSRS